MASISVQMHEMSLTVFGMGRSMPEMDVYWFEMASISVQMNETILTIVEMVLDMPEMDGY